MQDDNTEALERALANDGTVWLEVEGIPAEIPWRVVLLEDLYRAHQVTELPAAQAGGYYVCKHEYGGGEDWIVYADTYRIGERDFPTDRRELLAVSVTRGLRLRVEDRTPGGDELLRELVDDVLLRYPQARLNDLVEANKVDIGGGYPYNRSERALRAPEVASRDKPFTPKTEEPRPDQQIRTTAAHYGHTVQGLGVKAVAVRVNTTHRTYRKYRDKNWILTEDEFRKSVGQTIKEDWESCNGR